MSTHNPSVAFPFDQGGVDAFRNRVRGELPGVRSSHLAEAVAAAFGFRSNRLLRLAARAAPDGSGRLAAFDAEAFLARLSEMPRGGGAAAEASRAAALRLDWPRSGAFPYGIHVVAYAGGNYGPFMRAAAAYGAPGGRGTCIIGATARSATSSLGLREEGMPGPEGYLTWLRRCAKMDLEVFAVQDLMLDIGLAFALAMTGNVVVGGLPCGTAAGAVRMLRDAGVETYKVTDPTLLSRIDAFGSDGSLSESVACDRDWLRAACRDGASAP